MPSPDPRPPSQADDLEIRRAGPDDVGAIVALCQAALGWDPADPNEAFFRWKHLENPAGPSPMWVATDQGRLVGVRVFLRWRFVSGAGRELDAVRAVDTATHPDAQGRGVFSRLTRHALDELRDEGVDFVFNTPNDQSRPGYLKMGWQVVGRVPVAVRPRSPRALLAMARARVPAQKWSLATPAGRPAPRVLADRSALDELLGRLAPADGRADGLATRRDGEHLGWRYGFAPLRYRAVVAPGGPAHGVAVFRVRRRGEATEAAVCELLAPDPSTARGLIGQVAAATGADYLIAAASASAAPRLGLVPMPTQGPILTWREVAPGTRCPPLAAWSLALGDVELF